MRYLGWFLGLLAIGGFVAVVGQQRFASRKALGGLNAEHREAKADLEKVQKAIQAEQDKVDAVKETQRRVDAYVGMKEQLDQIARERDAQRRRLAAAGKGAGAAAIERVSKVGDELTEARNALRRLERSKNHGSEEIAWAKKLLGKVRSTR